MKQVYCYRLRSEDGSIGDWSVVDPETTLSYKIHIRLKNGATHIFLSLHDRDLENWCKLREFALDVKRVEIEDNDDTKLNDGWSVINQC